MPPVPDTPVTLTVTDREIGWPTRCGQTRDASCLRRIWTERTWCVAWRRVERLSLSTWTRIAFVPGRSYEYYLAQAGGVDSNRHMGERPKIYDIDGDRRKRNAEIQPEDRIHLSTNSPIFYLGPVATVLSLITSSISVYLLLN